MTAAPHHPRLMTAEALFRYALPGKRTELVRGQLVVREPATLLHARVTLKLGTVLENWLTANPIGFAYAGDPGFVIERRPDTVRAPDLAFIRADRVPPREERVLRSSRPTSPSKYDHPGIVPGKCE